DSSAPFADLSPLDPVSLPLSAVVESARRSITWAAPASLSLCRWLDMTRPIRIVIASKHSRFRDGLQKRLELESEVAVAGEACDALEAARLVRALDADVLLIDGDVFHMSGLQEIHGSAGHVRIILLISSVDAAYAIEALQLGARGIVMKVATSELLLRSIRAVMDGRYWVNDEPVADL